MGRRPLLCEGSLRACSIHTSRSECAYSCRQCYLLATHRLQARAARRAARCAAAAAPEAVSQRSSALSIGLPDALHACCLLSDSLPVPPRPGQCSCTRRHAVQAAPRPPRHPNCCRQLDQMPPGGASGAWWWQRREGRRRRSSHRQQNHPTCRRLVAAAAGS